MGKDRRRKGSRFLQGYPLPEIGEGYRRVVLSVPCPLPEPLIDAVEYHTSTEEAILPLDGDIAMAFAPATPAGSVPLEKMKAYRIPRGTMVILKAGAWHSGPYVIGSKAVHILVALPERTYANDCVVKKLSGTERLKITGT